MSLEKYVCLLKLDRNKTPNKEWKLAEGKKALYFINRPGGANLHFLSSYSSRIWQCKRWGDFSAVIYVATFKLSHHFFALMHYLLALLKWRLTNRATKYWISLYASSEDFISERTLLNNNTRKVSQRLKQDQIKVVYLRASIHRLKLTLQ